MAIQSVGSENLYYTIDKGDHIKFKTSNMNLDNIFHLKSENTDIILEHLIENKNRYLSTHNQIQQANHYQINSRERVVILYFF